MQITIICEMRYRCTYEHLAILRSGLICGVLCEFIRGVCRKKEIDRTDHIKCGKQGHNLGADEMGKSVVRAYCEKRLIHYLHPVWVCMCVLKI